MPENVLTRDICIDAVRSDTYEAIYVMSEYARFNPYMDEDMFAEAMVASLPIYCRLEEGTAEEIKIDNRLNEFRTPKNLGLALELASGFVTQIMQQKR